MTISKRVRFEVFKRDKFTCQYCGKKAPDVVLHVDHIQPKSKGGANAEINLITSCLDCNLGKGARVLSDDSVVTKQHEQLRLLQERKEQLSMMLDWQKSLMGLDNDAVDELETFWCDLADWHGVTEEGKKELRKHIRKFGIEEVIAAMRIASEQYFDYDEGGKPTEESSNKGFNKLGGICHVRKAEKDHPELKEVFYIQGILRNRLSYWDPRRGRECLDVALSWGATPAKLKHIAFDSTSWTAWNNKMWAYIEDLRKAEEGENASD